MDKRYVDPGETVSVELPYSEVCMHMRVAGKRMDVQFLSERNGAQLLNANGSRFSFPILPGEAGFYRETDGRHYYYPDN